MLAAFAATLLPHALWLPSWYALVLGGVVVARWAQRRRYGLAWPVWIKFPLLLTVMGLVVLEFGNPFARQAGTAALLGLTTLKLIESERRRDGLLAVTVCLFLISVQFLFNEGIGVTLYMLVPTLLAFLALNEISAPQGMRGGLTAEFGRVGREIGALLLIALPLTVFLFLSVPRLETPLWGTRENSWKGRTGLGDTMAPGSITELLGDDTPVMRVTFESAIPRRSSLYWRGPVLWNFDGQAWTRPGYGGLRGPLARQNHSSDPAGPNVARYRVTLEATDRNGLYALDIAERTPSDAAMLIDGQVVRATPIRSPYAYEASATLDGPLPLRDFPSLQQSLATKLPAELNPRTAQLAQSWRTELGDDRVALARRALSYFRNEPFSYTLGPPPLVGAHRMDEFLFETRAGFCEHYAAAFVVLMRSAGVPARVVTGFQGGQFNRTGGYFVIRNSDAHAWAEILVDGQGWVRVDPTAAVDPSRIEEASGAVGEQSLLADGGWLRDFRERLDTIRAWWTDTIIRFDTLRQRQFFANLGIDLNDWRQVGAWMAGGLGVIALLAALLIFLRRDGGPRDAALRSYQRFLRRLGKLGIQAPPQEGASTLAARVASLRPQWAQSARAVADAYEAARYGIVQDDSQKALDAAIAAFFRAAR